MYILLKAFAIVLCIILFVFRKKFAKWSVGFYGSKGPSEKYWQYFYVVVAIVMFVFVVVGIIPVG